MNVKNYKKYHEEYMMHNTGTSAEECCLLISVIPFYAFLSSLLVCYIPKNLNPFVEFLLIILPVILNCTVLSNVHHIIFPTVALLSITLIIVKTDINNVKNVLKTVVNDEKLFMSNFRASTNFVSAICILSVDFTIFPKRFIKTESFGFGFMDLGVGFFICSNGFVEKHLVTQRQLFKLIKTETVLCALGIIRVFSVKSMEYHEHVSEYGVHWNFFFTLALCHLASYLITYLNKNVNPVYISAITGIFHQMLLLLGLQDWVLIEKPRDSFLTANKEGLVSCLGYISLYFGASSVSKHILNSKNITYKELLFKLTLLALFIWLGSAVSVTMVNISRRLVNLSYIFWILALSLTELALFVIFEILTWGIKVTKPFHTISPLSDLLKSINSYGLLFFILSNLLTGLVNVIFQTLLLGEVRSMIIIIGYMIVLCSVIYTLFVRNFGFNY